MNPLSTRRLSKRFRPQIVLLLIVALVAGGCAEAEDGAEVSVGSTPEAAEVTPTTVAAAAAADGLIESAEADGIEFGATLDEFLGSSSGRPSSSTPPEGFEEIEWLDLVPAGFTAEEISAKFDQRISRVQPGSAEADQIYAEMQAEFDDQPVKPELSGSEVQLAGFVAPITYIDDLITEFLLVPYFGACVHVPPPPSNQTIMVQLQEGEALTIEESWGPVWVTGTLTVDGAETEIGTAGYSILSAQSGVYDDF